MHKSSMVVLVVLGVLQYLAHISDCQTTARVSTTSGSCMPGQWECKSTPGYCLNLNQVCDFITDCPEADDEKECGSCSFDKHNLCGWHNIGPKNSQQWVLKNASQFASNQYLPNTDSTGNSKADFMIIDTSTGNSAAVMSTPELGKTGSNCKMTFSYYHYNPKNPNFLLSVEVYLKKYNKNKTMMSLVKSEKDWIPVLIHIGSMDQGFKVMITSKGIRSTPSEPFADIAVDNFQFINCENIANVNFNTTLSCNFENGTCGWSDVDMHTNSKLDWVRNNKPTVDPGYDHTSMLRPPAPSSGYWLTTRREANMSGYNTATLMSVSKMDLKASHCLSFWYHMWGRNPTTFALEVNQYKSESNGTVKWMKRLPQSNNWIKDMVTIQSPFPSYLMFRATLQSRTGLREDNIGLDDIVWTTGQCPDKPLCDFEVDFCGWISVNNSWARVVPSASRINAPLDDHTTGTPNGTVAYFDKVGGQAIMYYIYNQSVPNGNVVYPVPTDQMCLKMWFYRNTPSPKNSTISVEILHNYLTNPKIEPIYTTPDSKQGLYSNDWIHLRVNLSLVKNDVIRIRGNIYEEDAVLAVDDVLLVNHPCEPLGWCDFESDMCGWSNAPPKGASEPVLWLRNSGETGTSKYGPKYDHTVGGKEGWYAVVPLDTERTGTAILRSEPLMYKSSNICVKFWYLINAEDNKVSPKLQLLYTTPDSVKAPEVLDTIVSSTNWNPWQQYSQTFPIIHSSVFRLLFKTLEGNVSLSDVAIDDIQVFGHSCKDLTTVSTLSPLSTTQIPLNEHYYDCNFEGTDCQWSYKNNWTRTSWATETRKVGPRVDHTYKSTAGHYLLFDPSVNPVNTSIPLTQIQSYLVPMTSSPHCLSFWYYTDSESVINISVGYYVPTGIFDPQHNLLHITPTMVTNVWKEIQTQLPVIPNIVLDIKLNYGIEMIGGFAIDDIVVTPGECPVRSDQICDFSYNYCGYKLKWLLPKSGPNIGYIANADTLDGEGILGPKYDHTTKSVGNYFLFSNKASDPIVDYKTELVIQNLPKASFRGSCLKFWYQITTGQTWNFYIFVTQQDDYDYDYNTPEYIVPYANHSMWTLGQLTIRADFVHKIVFSLYKQDEHGYIALDDISISDGECEAPISCDFDVDSCSWHDVDNMTDSDWNWGRYTGPPVNSSWPGPWYDHTLRREGGSYLYLTAFKHNVDSVWTKNAYIESMPVSVGKGYCLQFYTYLVGSDTSLEVSAIEYGGESALNGPKHVLTHITASTLIWNKYTVKIDPVLLSNPVEVAIRIKGSFKDSMSFIGLDDILLSTDMSTCVGTESVFKCANNKTVSIDKVCNFIKDCTDGSDELDCGNCDFEKHWCGWHNSDTDPDDYDYDDENEQFKMSLADPFAVIKTDGSGNGTGYFIRIEAPDGYDNSAVLYSSESRLNMFKRSYMTCKMTFELFMNASKQSSLRLRTREGLNSYTYIWRTTGYQQKQWQTIDTFIGEHTVPFSIAFIGHIAGRLDTIAIDNIRLNDCVPHFNVNQTVCTDGTVMCLETKVCINQYSFCDGMDDCGDQSDESSLRCSESLPICNFETNHDNCSFTIETDKDSTTHWTQTASGANLLRVTGPVNDHTYRLEGKGHYLTLRGSTVDAKKKSRIVTNWVQGVGGNCALRVFYYLYGNDSQMGGINIYGRSMKQTLVTSYSRSGNLGQQWSRVIVPISGYQPFQFIIEGVVGSGDSSDLAVDDISFSSECKIAKDHWITTTIKAPSTIPTKGTTRTVSTVRPPSTSTTGNVNTQTTGAPKVSTASALTQSNSKTTKSNTKTTMSSMKSSSNAKTNGLSTNTHISTNPSAKTSKTTKGTETDTTPKSNLHKAEHSSKKWKFGPGEMTASIIVPILLIATVVAVLWYRRHRMSRADDTERLNIHVIPMNDVNFDRR